MAAAALECWPTRTTTATTTEDDTAEQQVLMRTHHRSELASATSSSLPSSSKDSSNLIHKNKFHKFSRNFSDAITSFKNTLNLNNNNNPESPPSSKKLAWASVLRNLTQLYPGTQLPDNLISSIRVATLIAINRRDMKLSDTDLSRPFLCYAQAEFDMKDVLLHIKLIEQTLESDQPAIVIQQERGGGDGEVQVQGSVLKLSFACNALISWPAMSAVLDSFSVCSKRAQIFEKKGFTLGVVLVVVRSGHEKLVRTQVDNALKFSLKKPKTGAVNVKLPFGLCGCQEESFKGRELGEIGEDSGSGKEFENSSQKIQLQRPLPTSAFIISVDEWQTIKSGGGEIEKWLLNADNIEFTEQIRHNSYKGVYMGKRVGIEKLKGCEKGNSYEFEIHKDLLELMTCGHRNILQFCGICVDDNHGLCVVTKFMVGGSVHDLMLKNKKLHSKDIVRIAVDVAEGIKFMNDHGVAFRDLNTQRILLDRHGNACLGDMGVVTACKSVGEAMEYETDGYRWLAPEIIAGDPESVTETSMSNVYSYGMIIWEMVTGEAAYSALSPVQAAVGIAACGLRPEIPKDCQPNLKYIMTKCWNNTPSKRPRFSDILAILLQPCNNNR